MNNEDNIHYLLGPVAIEVFKRSLWRRARIRLGSNASYQKLFDTTIACIKELGYTINKEGVKRENGTETIPR